MLIVILIAIAVICAFAAVSVFRSSSGHDDGADMKRPKTIRCPSCGARATVHGKSWRCGWCGDSGLLK